MVIKDWKRMKSREYWLIPYSWDKWTGKRHRKIEIMIDSDTQGYIVWTGPNTSKNFKTKTQALKYAKAYMRKH